MAADDRRASCGGIAIVLEPGSRKTLLVACKVSSTGICVLSESERAYLEMSVENRIAALLERFRTDKVDAAAMLDSCRYTVTAVRARILKFGPRSSSA